MSTGMWHGGAGLGPAHGGMEKLKKKWHGNAGCDGQRTGTAAEKDTEAQLNAINKTFIQTITQYRAHFSLAFKKGFSTLQSPYKCY